MSARERALYAGTAAFSLATTVIGSGIFTQVAVAVERVTTELGDLEQLGADLTHEADDLARQRGGR